MTLTVSGILTELIPTLGSCFVAILPKNAPSPISVIASPLTFKLGKITFLLDLNFSLPLSEKPVITVPDI